MTNFRFHHLLLLGIGFAGAALAQTPAGKLSLKWSDDLLRRKPEWYASTEARTAAAKIAEINQGGKGNTIASERRSGYNDHGNGPADLLERDYPAWCAKHARPPATSPATSPQ